MIALPLFLALSACQKPVPPVRPGPERLPAPEADLVYFVMVDRFANGDPGNDSPAGEPPADPGDPQGWHGGDLAGVIDHLDHLQQLGVRTVWLSPISDSRSAKFKEWGAFHGYWVDDGAALEPRFGTLDDLARLREELHRRDMRLVLDMVFNHVSWDAPLRTLHPDWFHADQPVQDWQDALQVRDGWVHGLPDLAQEKPEVEAYLTDQAHAWGARADGFRIDAVKHMPMSFLAGLNTALGEELDPFWVLGEDFEGNPARLARTLREGAFGAVFDFPLRYAMIDVFCKDAPVGRLAGILSDDRFYEDRARDGLVTFLDNHDTPRLMSECGGERWRVDQALAFLLTARGTPSLSWGTEFLLEGAAEPANRASIPWGSPVRAAPVLSELAALRAAHPALVRGLSRPLLLTDSAYAYVRYADEEAVIIGVNRGTEAVMLGLPAGLQGVLSPPRVWAGSSPAPPAMPNPEGGLWLPPGALSLHVIRGVKPPPERTEVRVSVRAQADLAEGERLVAVGAGPELGEWDPAAGVPLELGEDGVGVGMITVPEGTVLAWKLVILAKDGSPRWESWGDRYALALEDLALEVAFDR